jgi:DNA-binding LacI/PurR family transcriptional regulator
MTSPETHKDVTMNDVAARCGVSYQTVSRVINGMPDVADATRSRVRRALEELGYRPNLTARHLVSRRSTVIGLVTFATGLYGPSQTMINVEEAAKETGYSVMFAGIGEENVEEIRVAVDELCAHRVAGILMHFPLEIDLRLLRDLCRNVPLVAMDSDFGFEAPSVLVRQERASRRATEHLITLGHRQIACLRAPLIWRAARLRYQGWLKALKAARLRPGPCVEGDWTSRGGFEAAQELIKNYRGQFTALVVENDQMALGAIRAFEDNGIRVPSEVSVVGFDDIPEAEFFRPPLTTVKQDFVSIGKLGIRCLVEQLSGGLPSPKVYTVTPTFVERLSTRPPPGGRCK